MKTFEPYEKVLFRIQKTSKWYPALYQALEEDYHMVIGSDEAIEDNDIILYEGNEHLLGKVGEPTPKWTPKEGEYVVVWNDSNKDTDILANIYIYGGKYNNSYHKMMSSCISHHVAFVFDLLELGKPISYFKNRGFWV